MSREICGCDNIVIRAMWDAIKKLSRINNSRVKRRLVLNRRLNKYQRYTLSNRFFYLIRLIFFLCVYACYIDVRRVTYLCFKIHMFLDLIAIK